MIICLHLIEKRAGVIKTSKFKHYYGSVLDDIRIKNNEIGPRYYYPLYLLRRLYYALVLIALGDYPMVQLFIILFLLVIPVSTLLMSLLRQYKKL